MQVLDTFCPFVCWQGLWKLTKLPLTLRNVIPFSLAQSCHLAGSGLSDYALWKEHEGTHLISWQPRVTPVLRTKDEDLARSYGEGFLHQSNVLVAELLPKASLGGAQ